MGMDWRDRARLWDRYAAAPPAAQALLRLMYQAGLEDGQDIAWQEAAEDPRIALIISGHLYEVDRAARRRAADAGTLVVET